MNEPTKLARILTAELFARATAEKALELVAVARDGAPLDAEFRERVKVFRRACRLASAAIDDAHNAAFRLTLEKMRADFDALAVAPLGRSPSVLPSQKQGTPERQAELPLPEVRRKRTVCTCPEQPEPEGLRCEVHDLWPWEVKPFCPCGEPAILPSVDGQPPICRHCVDAVLAYRPRERFSQE